MIVGTSLTTPLSKRLIQHFMGDIVVINLHKIDIDPLKRDLFIQERAGEVFEELDKIL